MLCDAEETTAHYLGPGHGFGPVQSDELLILAVFRTTPVRPCGRLAGNAFPKDRLKNGELSLARVRHTPRPEFEAKVVAARADAEQGFLGVSSAEALRLRELRRVYEKIGPNCAIRAVCVLDYVTAKDTFEGHAALRFCAKHDELKPSNRGKVREFVAKDLADTFSALRSLDDVYSEEAP